MDYMGRYLQWSTDHFFDEETRNELQSIRENSAEIIDRFNKDLSFGTGGLRGIIGAGTNRMNKYTVGKATQGLANYIIKMGGADKGVAIAYDSRHMSPEFSEQAALCLNANGIKTFRFESLRPTPELSFALRELGCIAGIVVTASHNPPEYNGYKVYWEDGAQITSPRDCEIIAEVNAVQDFSKVKMIDRFDAERRGLFNVIGAEIDDRYIEELKKLVLSPEAIAECGQKLSIVYTPLHGTGNIPVKRILNELGFEKLFVVPEQEHPDSNFSTVAYPNPEDPEAFSLALSYAREIDADIVLATDPDADRLGVYAKDAKTGNYMAFNGNMSGILIADYEFDIMRKRGLIPNNGALIKTIVTSNMADAVAKEYGINLIEVLTGFKYIGEKIKLFEEDKSFEYLFGYEESYGCLVGTHARDKDAIVAVMALCEAAAYYMVKNMTLCDQMENLYQKHGYYKEDLISATLKGSEGANRIESIMTSLRSNPPEHFGGLKVIAIRDYKSGIRTDLIINEETSTGLPNSNVLYYELENSAWCCVRPSGTEPKVKIYLGVKGDSLSKADDSLKNLREALVNILK